MQASSFSRSIAVALMLLSFSSCYTYKLATHAQPGGDELVSTTVHAQSLFWGLVNKPQVLRPGPCDALDLPGVAEVKVETNFANVLLTFATLGIYCPMR
ncbi:MAG TPA: hypothetical protein P5248_12080, partial [Bacteroidales bacterium]|nr:hypothetical protein [Bacteroidales bacterium]